MFWNWIIWLSLDIFQELSYCHNPLQSKSLVPGTQKTLWVPVYTKPSQIPRHIGPTLAQRGADRIHVGPTWDQRSCCRQCQGCFSWVFSRIENISPYLVWNHLSFSIKPHYNARNLRISVISCCTSVRACWPLRILAVTGIALWQNVCGSWSTMVQVITCYLLGAKPLPKPPPVGSGTPVFRLGSRIDPHRHRGVVKVHWRVPWVGGLFSWVVATFTM